MRFKNIIKLIFGILFSIGLYAFIAVIYFIEHIIIEANNGIHKLRNSTDRC